MHRFFERLKNQFQVSKPALDDILFHASPLTPKTKKSFRPAGVRQQEVFLVLEGVVRCHSLYNTSYEEKEWTRWFFEKGDIAIHPDGLLSEEISEVSLSGYAKTELAVIKTDDYVRLMSKHMEFRLITNTLINNYFKKRTAYDYCMRFLSADKRYEWFADTYPYINARVQNQHLADFLGHTAQSLSRTKKNLIRQAKNLHFNSGNN